MSKVSFRTRQIDFNKPLTIVKHDSPLFHELGEGTFINRGVPQVPSGMEREEENEHHFLEVIQALQLQKQPDAVIPVPEILDRSKAYEELYTSGFTPTKNLIHIRTIALAEDEPVEYDMDTDDEDWLHRSDLNLPPEKFESMIDRLERGCGQRVMNLEEARLLLNDDPSLVIAVYDYWLNKRVQCRQPLLLSVRQEKRDGGSNNDPYVAFRRRTERMQTRKNRKNDEYSYEKMLILREQMTALGGIMSRLVCREITKRSIIEDDRRIFQLRYKLADWSAATLVEADSIAQKSPKYLERLISNSSRKHPSRKRKLPPRSAEASKLECSDISEEERPPRKQEDPFAFIRIPGCKYQRPLDLRTTPIGEDVFGTYRLSRVPCVIHSYRRSYTGYLRRRLGRGGRVLFDRTPAPSKELNDYFLRLDSDYLPAGTAKNETRRWVPTSQRQVESLKFEGPASRVFPSREPVDGSGASRHQFLPKKLQKLLLNNPPDHVLNMALSRLVTRASLANIQTATWGVSRQNNWADRVGTAVPNSNAECQKSFSPIPRTGSHSHEPSISFSTFVDSSEPPRRTSASSRLVRSPSSGVPADAHRPIGKEVTLQTPKHLSASMKSLMSSVSSQGGPGLHQFNGVTLKKTINVANNSCNTNSNSRRTNGDDVKLSISFSGVNGSSKRDRDEFDWLPHPSSTASGLSSTENDSSDAGVPLPPEGGVAVSETNKNGIITPVNPLMYNI